MSVGERSGGLEADAPEERIQAIRGSIRCLVLGVLSLLPAVGVVFGLVAVGEGRAVLRARRGLWNPGERLVTAGFVLSAVGLLLGLMAGTTFVIGIFSALTG